MIITNRDLKGMCDTVDKQIFGLTAARSLPINRTDIEQIERQIAALSRRRVALCGAIVNRRVEASKPLVSLSRWASGDGALDTIPDNDWVGGGVYSPFLANRGM